MSTTHIEWAELAPRRNSRLTFGWILPGNTLNQEQLKNQASVIWDLFTIWLERATTAAVAQVETLEWLTLQLFWPWSVHAHSWSLTGHAWGWHHGTADAHPPLVLSSCTELALYSSSSLLSWVGKRWSSINSSSAAFPSLWQQELKMITYCTEASKCHSWTLSIKSC